MPTRPERTRHGVMRSIGRTHYGSADVLEPVEIGKPDLADDQVMIRVRAVSIGPWVTHVMQGDPLIMRLVTGLRRPRASGFESDVAGEIVDVGADARGFQIGDPVYGTVDAAFAEFAVASPEAVAPKPRNLSFAEAAAVPVAAMTALLALREHGHVESGHRVLIIGASGGVGTFAVQLAKSMGAEVTAVCAGDAVDLVVSLGADHVIDYARRDLRNVNERYDVILQLAGSDSVADLRQLLVPSGTLVLTSGEGGRWIGPLGRLAKGLVLDRFVKEHVTTFVATSNRDDLIHLTGLIEAGQLTPVIERCLPFERTVEAVASFEAGHARGKTVVVM